MNTEFIFSSFLIDNDRLNIKIKHIIVHLTTVKNPLKLITSRIKMPAQPIKLLKILILMHNIILFYPNLFNK